MDEQNGNDIRHTPKDRSDTGNTARDAVIVRTSVIGLAVNLVLAAVKAAVGLGAGSIAVVLDAVNNLTDALSGVITILGAKLSEKEPDKNHPLGYGRIEYLSATLVAFLVLYAGVTALAESVKKMFSPRPADVVPALSLSCSMPSTTSPTHSPESSRSSGQSFPEKSRTKSTRSATEG